MTSASDLTAQTAPASDNSMVEKARDIEQQYMNNCSPESTINSGSNPLSAKPNSKQTDPSSSNQDFKGNPGDYKDWANGKKWGKFDNNNDKNNGAKEQQNMCECMKDIKKKQTPAKKNALFSACMDKLNCNNAKCWEKKAKEYKKKYSNHPPLPQIQNLELEKNDNINLNPSLITNHHQKNINDFEIILISLGLIFVIITILLLIRKWRKNKEYQKIITDVNNINNMNTTKTPTKQSNQTKKENEHELKQKTIKSIKKKLNSIKNKINHNKNYDQNNEKTILKLKVEYS